MPLLLRQRYQLSLRHCSRLWLVACVPFKAPVEVNALGWFDPLVTVNDATGIERGIVANLILTSNLSYPQGPYGDLVLPNVRIASERHSHFSSCGYGRSAATAELHFRHFDLTVPQNGYFGSAYPGALQKDCPRFTIVYGKVLPNLVDDISTIRFPGCASEMRANTSFILPHYTIDPSQPPVVDPSSSQVFSNQNLTYIRQLFATLNVSVDADIGWHDECLQVTVIGRDGVPAAEMLGNNGTNTTRLVTRVQQVYRLLMAQYVNKQIRKEPSSNVSAAATMTTEPAPRKFNGTVVNPNRIRLQQQHISTWILDECLAFLFICAITACSLIHPRPVIQKNSYSIAAVASLPAGSRVITELKEACDPAIPQGVEELGGEKLKRERFFSGKRFSLGWWLDEGGNQKRFGIDIGAAAAKA